jgi:hypothetical protein
VVGMLREDLEAALWVRAGLSTDRPRWQRGGCRIPADPKTLYSVLRALEIVGEATKSVPPSVRALDPAIPWKEMGGMRDKLIHAYETVDVEILLKTVPCARLLRHRPEPGPARSDRLVAAPESALARLRRLHENPDAMLHFRQRGAGLRLLPLRAPAPRLQRRRSGRRPGEPARRRIPHPRERARELPRRAPSRRPGAGGAPPRRGVASGPPDGRPFREEGTAS